MKMLIKVTPLFAEPADVLATKLPQPIVGTEYSVVETYKLADLRKNDGQSNVTWFFLISVNDASILCQEGLNHF